MRWAVPLVFAACGTDEPPASGSVTLFVGMGAAGFERGQEVHVSRARLTVPADLDLDGRMDFVAIDGTSARPFMMGDDGQFAAAEPVESDEFVGGAAVADLDGDAKPDLVLGTYSAVLVYRGDGRGEFLEIGRYQRRSLATPVIVADLDDNGAVDIITLSDRSTVVTFLNDGTGGLSGPTESPTGVGPYTLATADFNEDGRADIATGNPDLGLGAEPPQTVSVLAGTGTGAAELMFEAPVDGIPRLAIGDLNNDRHLDIAVAATKVYGLLGDGDGNFAISTSWPLPASNVALADLNADGLLDAVVTHERELRVLVAASANDLVSTTTFTEPEPLADVDVVDVTGDGLVDVLVTAGDPNF